MARDPVSHLYNSARSPTRLLTSPLVLALSFSLSGCHGEDSGPGPIDSADGGDSGAETDADGDGVLATDDCDDADASVWAEGALEGDLETADLAGFCEGWCVRDVDGSVSIVSLEADTFADLSCIQDIQGALTVAHNPLLTHLGDLSNAYVHGRVTVSDNPALTSLVGIPRSGRLLLQENPALLSLEGLEGNTGFNELTIQDNDGLLDLSGLEQVDDIGGPLVTHGNEALISLDGLEQLWAVQTADPDDEARLEISDNPSLERIDALSSLSLISSSSSPNVAPLILSGNPSLQSLHGLEALAELGLLTIQDNDGLSSLEGLNSIGTGSEPLLVLTIEGNDGLLDLSGLESLETLDDGDGNLRVAENEALISVSGLESLVELWDLTLDANPSLTDVRPLYGLEAVHGDLTLTDNTSLPTAEALALVEQIEAIGGEVTISGNAP